jgi:DNA-binding NtrC family response regulator
VGEVLDHGQDLTDVKLRLSPDQPEFLADIQFAGLTEDYLGQLVRISLRRESVASRQDVGFRNMVGTSPAMHEVFRKIRLYAASDAAVIITGETGSGKELVAQALHEESPRHDKPFAALNCAAISEQLLESELFGHERGAFTGAVREHRGYFERADGGTLFLDEIGDMPLHTQTKLLRVLEDGRVQRVGGEKSRQVDVRFVGATNVPLEQAVAEKKFRADLYHRLAVLRIHLPPLRERPEDIPLLADLFLQQFNARYNKGVKRLTSEAIRLLQSYLWPGNVRELRNVIERVVVEAETEAIGARAFAEWIRERQQFAVGASIHETSKQLPVAIPYSPVNHHTAPQPSTVQQQPGKPELSEETIREAYRQAGGNISAAARQLGVHRATLYRHLQRLNLQRDDLS